MTFPARVRQGAHSAVLGLVMMLQVALIMSSCGENGSRPQQPPVKDLGIDLEGQAISTADYHGRVLVVSFWVGWAEACRMQLSELDSIQSEYTDRLSVVAVNYREEPDSVERFVAENPLDVRVTLDADGSVMASFTSSQVFPTTLLLDAQGAVRLEHRGYQPGSEDIRSGILGLIGPPG